MSNSNERDLANALRRLVLSVQATGRAILPASDKELLQTIVENAAHLFGAAAASIALVDERDSSLVFRVSYGAGQENVVGMRLPLDRGIAGYVAMTGQPLAVSDVEQDARFARETAEKTGYVPRSILAMPLLYDDRVLGVIEVLDKLQGHSFGMQDMELLGLFAKQAAMAIHSCQQFELLGDSLVKGLRDLVGPENEAIVNTALSPQAVPENNDVQDDLMTLADLFNSISRLGDAERKMCLQVLQAFANYARSSDYAHLGDTFTELES